MAENKVGLGRNLTSLGDLLTDICVCLCVHVFLYVVCVCVSKRGGGGEEKNQQSSSSSFLFFGGSSSCSSSKWPLRGGNLGDSCLYLFLSLLFLLDVFCFQTFQRTKQTKFINEKYKHFPAALFWYFPTHILCYITVDNSIPIVLCVYLAYFYKTSSSSFCCCVQRRTQRHIQQAVGVALFAWRRWPFVTIDRGKWRGLTIVFLGWDRKNWKKNL